MKAQEIRELSIEEIVEKVNELYEAHNRMKLNHAVSAIESPAMLRTNRKTIARMLTILREKELEQALQETTNQ